MAQTFLWSHSPSTPSDTTAPDFSAPANWTLAGDGPAPRAPTLGDAAVFGNGSSLAGLTGPQAIGPLQVTDGATLQLLGGADLAAAEAATGPGLLVADTLALSGHATLNASIAAVLRVNGAVHLGTDGTLGAGFSSSTVPNGIAVADFRHDPRHEVFVGASGTLDGAGTINASFTVDGLADVHGGRLSVNSFSFLYAGLQGSGTVRVEGDGRLSLAPAVHYHNPSAGQIGALDLAAGAGLDLGDANLTVTHDFTNANAGSGNAYDPMAGVTFTNDHHGAPAPAETGWVFGQGVSLALGGDAQASGAAGHYVLDLGTLHVGDSVTAHYTVRNAGGADAALLRGAIQNAANGAAITDADLSGSGVTAQDFGPLAGGQDSTPYTVTLTATQTASGTLGTLHIAGNFAFQAADLAITGTVLPASTPAPIDWNALAAQVEADFAATGAWFAPGAAPPPPPLPQVDWNALAAAVEAHHAETGTWWA